MKLPESLLQSLDSLPGFRREPFVAVHESGVQVNAIRLNPAKIPVIPSALSENFPEVYQLNREIWKTQLSAVPWCTHGYYLDERPVFTLDPLLHAGAYYVQDASSMFLGYALQKVLGEQRQLNVVDLCAAPGGKSTLLASLPHFRLVVANEVIRNRVPVLYENAVKWGSPHMLVSNNDPKDFQRLDDFFDVMVIDAPCSGSGLFRKDPEAIREWSPEAVDLCSFRQKRIIADALPALKAGGVLVYSTCSYSREEDEEILDWLIEEGQFESLSVPVKEEWGIVMTSSEKHKATGYRFYPDRLKGEGFFLACLRKKSGGDFTGNSRVKPETTSRRETEMLGTWLNEEADPFFFRKEKDIFFLPAGLIDDLIALQQALNLRKSGTRMGMLIKDALVPDHELALSQELKKDIPAVELNRDDALRFLRKENFRPDNAPDGWSLMRYAGLGLGFLKSMQNRANNYYPSEWRIRMK